MSRLLVDTHTFIWFVYDDPKLSPTARQALEDPSNQVLFSAASVWESSIKAGLRKLELFPNPVDFFRLQAEKSGFQFLSLELQHLEPISLLPQHHSDPFDRLLIAQALVENAPIVSRDAVFDAYNGLVRIW